MDNIEADRRLLRECSKDEAAYERLVTLFTDGQSTANYYDFILHNIKDIIFETDADGRWTFLSPAWETVTGFIVSESIGEKFTEYMHPGDNIDSQHFYRASQSDMKIGEHEARYLSASGEVIWFEVRARVLRDEAGHITGTVGVLRDITQRKQAEIAREQTERRYRQMFENNQAIKLVIDPDTGRIVDGNTAAADFYGYDPQTLRTLTIQDINILTDDDVFEEMQQARTQRRNFFEFRHRLASGEIREVDVFSSPLDTPDGTLLYSIVVDVTGRREAQRLYELLANNVHDLIVIHEPDGGVRYTSPSSLHVLGYTPDELRDMPLNNLTHPDDVAQIFQNMARLTPETPHIEPQRYRIQHRSGDYIWMESEVTAVYDDSGDLDSVVVSSRDITQRKLAEEHLRRYRNIVASTDDGISLVSSDYVYEIVNYVYLERTGLQREDIQGHHVAEVMGEDVFQQIVKPELDRCMAGETVRYADWFDFPATGERRYIAVTYSPYRDDSGTIAGAIVNTRDITPLQQAQEALEDSHALYQSLVNSLPMNIFRIDLDSRYTFVNQAMLDHYGMSPEDILGKTAHDFYPAQMADKYRQDNIYVIETGEILNVVEENVNPTTGEHRFVETMKIPIYNHRGEIEGIQVAFRDVTERKKMEDALRRSEQQFRTLAENTPDLIARIAQDTTHLYVNPAQAALMGLPPGEIIGKDNQALGIQADDTHPFAVAHKHIFATGEPVSEEIDFHGATGKRHLHVQMIPEFDDSGQVVTVLSVGHDITERKQMQEALEDSRALYQSLVDSLPLNIYRIAVDGRITFANRTLLDDLQLTLDDLLGKTAYDFYSPEMAAKYRQDDVYVIETGEILNVVEENVNPTTGEHLFVEVTKIPVYNHRGEIEGIQGVFRDITARKLMEDALRRSEQRFMHIANNIPGVVYQFMIDADGNQSFPFMSPGSEIFFGLSPEAIMQDASAVFDNVHPDDSDKIAGLIQDSFETMTLYEASYRLIGSDGRISHTLARAMPERLPDGSVLWTGIGLNVTAQKEAEDALRHSEQRFMHIANSTPGIVYQFMIDADGNQSFPFISQGVQDYGLTPEAIMQDAGIILDIVHPDDRERFQNSIADSMQTMSPYDITHRMIDASGQVHWIHARSMPEPAPDGGVLWTGISLNITAQKAAEEALRQSEAQYRELLNILPDGIIVHQDGRAVLVNQAAITILGAENPEQILGTPIIDYVHPAYRAFASQRIEAVLSGDTAQLPVTEQVFLRLDGSSVDVAASGIALDYAGQPAKLSVFRDITEQKRIQQREFDLALERERVNVLSNFVRDAAHEFRTPLSIIGVNMHLMQRISDPDRQAKKVAQINYQVKHLTDLLDMMLLLSRLESSAELEHLPVDFSKLLQSLCQTMAESYPDGPALICHDLPQLPAFYGDTDYLTSALRQIIKNALRFTPESGRVTVQAEFTGQTIQLHIRDTGPGISDDMMPHIFKTFWRQDTAHSTPGFGLGLPVALKIIQRHGGRIEVESQVNVGSTFSVILPCK